MFAVIQTGGKQYSVKTNDVLRIEKLEAEVGAKITFDTVLLRGEEDGVGLEVGTPVIAGARVTAEVVSQGRADKIMVVKFKNKVRYRRKNGHRQPFTEVKIVSLN